MKKLSVVTVCLNDKDGAERTLRSLFSQSFDDFEHIVIDGGSTDGTLDVFEKYRDKIDKFVSEKDEGIYDAMNKGVSLAEGEYVFFLNAGDWLVSRNSLERAFAPPPAAEIVYFDALIETPKGRLVRKPSPSKLSDLFMYLDTIPHQNSFTAKKLFDRAGLFDKKYKIAADYEFFLRALYVFRADYEYRNFPIAVNDLKGTSSKLSNRRKSYAERRAAQNERFPSNKLAVFRALNPFLYYLYKYPKYFYYLARSLASDKYLNV